MSWLLDTSILLRAVDNNSPQQQIALEALDALDARQEIVCLVPQNLVEFWAVATRPIESNGLNILLKKQKMRSTGCDHCSS